MTEEELNKASQKHVGEPLGVTALKEFHLKDRSNYEKDLKDKIFFIARNALGGNENLMGDKPIAQMQKQTRSKHAKLSENTIKTL